MQCALALSLAGLKEDERAKRSPYVIPGKYIHEHTLLGELYRVLARIARGLSDDGIFLPYCICMYMSARLLLADWQL